MHKSICTGTQAYHVQHLVDLNNPSVKKVLVHFKWSFFSGSGPGSDWVFVSGPGHHKTFLPKVASPKSPKSVELWSSKVLVHFRWSFTGVLFQDQDSSAAKAPSQSETTDFTNRTHCIRVRYWFALDWVTGSHYFGVRYTVYTRGRQTSCDSSINVWQEQIKVKSKISNVWFCLYIYWTSHKETQDILWEK